MVKANRAPFFHASRIWAICEKYGTEHQDQRYWSSKAQSGEFTYEQSSGMIRAWSKHDAAGFTAMVRYFLPSFDLKSTPWDPQPIPSQEPTPEQPQQAQQEPETPKEPEQTAKVYQVMTPGYIKPKIYDEIANMIDSKKQICLVGPSGLGKSRMVREIAASLGRDVSVFTFGGGIRFQHVFYTTEMRSGETYCKLLPFLEAIQRPGIVCVDEIMAGDEDILIGLNSLTEKSQRYIMTPLGRISVHDDCTIVATSNTTGREVSEIYTGTKRQDTSVLNRFTLVRMTYSEEIERELLAGLPRHSTDFILSRLAAIRLKARENQISQDFSTRGLIQVKELILDCGMDKSRAFELVFLNPLSEAERLAMDVAI